MNVGEWRSVPRQFGKDYSYAYDECGAFGRIGCFDGIDDGFLRGLLWLGGV